MNAAVFVFLTLGVFFNFCAALGMVRMPDLFCRLQTASKASTLGGIFLALGAGIHFFEKGYFLNAVCVSLFLLITTPVSAHVLAVIRKHQR
ncbi:MAG: monovalent cation/H(+) antiporter subunit G [Pseudobdellovibrionaceae bacterium]